LCLDLLPLLKIYILRFNLFPKYSFQERIPLSMSANPFQVHWSSSGSDLWLFHDCFFDSNQSTHFGPPILSDWLCAGGFHSVAKIFVWKQNLEKKLSFATLPSRQYDCLASDCSVLSKWKEQESTRGYFLF
jgi:hypothetical protein